MPAKAKLLSAQARGLYRLSTRSESHVSLGSPCRRQSHRNSQYGTGMLRNRAGVVGMLIFGMNGLELLLSPSSSLEKSVAGETEPMSASNFIVIRHSTLKFVPNVDSRQGLLERKPSIRCKNERCRRGFRISTIAGTTVSASGAVRGRTSGTPGYRRAGIRNTNCVYDCPSEIEPHLISPRWDGASDHQQCRCKDGGLKHSRFLFGTSYLASILVWGFSEIADHHTQPQTLGLVYLIQQLIIHSFGRNSQWLVCFQSALQRRHVERDGCRS